MANRKLSRLRGLPSDLILKLGSRGILTCKDLLMVAPLDLMDILDVTYPRLQDFVSAVSVACAPSAKNALSMHQERAGKGFLPTSIPRLDSILKGGLPPCTVTEVSGPPGSGKTQFCLMLSVQSALPEAVGGCGSPVIYVDTEGAFSAERLVEIAQCRLSAAPVTGPRSSRGTPSGFSPSPPSTPPLSSPALPGAPPRTHLNEPSQATPPGAPPHTHPNKPSQATPPSVAPPNTRRPSNPSQGTQDSNLLELARSVHVYKKLTCKSFLEFLDGLDVVIASKGAGLVIVDSIASLVRKEFDVTSNRGAMERTALLLKLSARLRYLSESCGTQVLVTNQIVTKVSRGGDELSGEGSGGDVLTSALGNAWYHSVNTRLLLDFRQDQKRQLSVVKSPLCERSSVLVTIERGGFLIAPSTDSDDDAHSNKDGKSIVNINATALGSLHHRGFSVEFPGQ